MLVMLLLSCHCFAQKPIPVLNQHVKVNVSMWLAYTVKGLVHMTTDRHVVW